MERPRGDAPWRRTVRRFLLAFAPFLFTLLCVGTVQLWNQAEPEEVLPPTPTRETALGSATADTPATLVPDEALLAHTPAVPPATGSSPLETATPVAPTPPATALPPNEEIQLLGPPGDSTVSRFVPISFYWSWPEQVQDNQRLTLYLINAGEEVALASRDRPNLGAGYYAGVIPSDLALGPGEYAWQVRLEQIDPPQVLARSQTRRVILEE